MSKHSRKRARPNFWASIGANRLALIVVTGITFVAVRTAQFLLAGHKVVTFPDSSRYRVEDSGALEFSLVIEQAHPTVVTSFYSLFANDETRILAQWILSTSAWLLLICGVALLFRTLWVSVVAVLAIFTIGSSFYVVQWNSTILSEPLNITTFVFGLGALVFWWGTKRKLWLFTSIIFFGLTVANRPNMWVLLLAMLIVIPILAKRMTMTRTTVIVAMVVSVVFLALGVFQQRLNDENHAGEGALNRIGWAYVSVLSDESPLATSLLPAVLRSGVPICMIPQKPFLSDDGASNLVIDLQNTCPKGVEWVNDNFLTWYLGFLSANPVKTLGALGDLVGPSAQALEYAQDSQINAPPLLSGLFVLDSPAAAWVLVTVSLVAGLISLTIRSIRKKSGALVGMLILELGLIVSWASGVLIHVWDIHRIVVTSVIGINIIAVLMIATVIEAGAEQVRLQRQ